MIILIIKILLVIASICTIGILPLLALLNKWIWNNIITVHVLTCAKPIESFWIVLGLTVTSGLMIGIGKLLSLFNKD